MSQFEQLESPYSFESTTPAVTIADLVDATFKFDPEMKEHFSGKSRYPRFTIGNDNTTIEITTTDTQAFNKFIKGMEVAAATIVFRTPVTATTIGVSGPSCTQDDQVYGFAISTCRVTDAVEVKGDGKGKDVGEFKIMLRAAQKESDGSDPTIEFLTAPPE